MFALGQPVVIQSSNDQPDVIEVVGQRPGQVLKIDRRTYQIKQTPHSAQKDTFQLLRGLPAVTIGPDDQINLLGASNVTIQINGHESQTDLHTLHGSDIERIEIITNPSAQYSAQGTGGIINIVLRKKKDEGLSGTASLEGSELGSLTANATLKDKKGKWTYEISPDVNFGNARSSTYHKRRTVEVLPNRASTINTEDGGGPSRIGNLGAQATATYELNSKTNISAEGYASTYRQRSVNHADFIGRTPDFESFSQRQTRDGVADILFGLLTLDHKGSREGETLNASLSAFGNPHTRQATSALLSDGNSFLSATRTGNLYVDGQIDWQHPIGGKELLSMGAAWSLQRSHHHYRFTNSDNADFGNDSVDEFRGMQSTNSAYATFQQQFGTWTFMPGVRLEQNNRHISSAGQAAVKISRIDLFPTLHVEHPLSKTLLATLSYSKRIDRPQFNSLRPYPVQIDVISIAQGNPRLRNQSTDSYELNLHFHHDKIDAGMIIYDRETRQLVGDSFSVNASGQNVVTWINIGHQRDSGAEIDINAPLVSRLKAQVSVNVFQSQVPVAAVRSHATEQGFRFTANSTLEWDGPDRREKPGDIAQLLWHYESPSTDFQFRNFGWNQLTLSYTHSLTRELSLTAAADSGGLHLGHRLLAPFVQEYYREHNRPEFRLKLMKTFGKP
jgi:ferric enterobactin receptor